MSTSNLPQLPALLATNNKSGTYLCTFKNVWNKEKDRSCRVAGSTKTVGKVLGKGKVGEVKWKDEFVEQYPELAKFKCIRVVKPSDSKQNCYELKFEAKE